MLPSVRVGDFNRLKVKELARREGYGPVFGVYLEGGREGDILMPQKYVPEGVEPGDEVDCFVYLDQEERLVATTEKPLAKVGDFAWLKCAWVNEYGAFLDWGVTKNLFCPFREQKRHMEVGNSYLVYIYIDKESYRLAASAKVERFLSDEPAPYRPGDEVGLLGGLGPCGRPCCCATWQRRYPSHLNADRFRGENPARLNGTCGRFKCCLAFERDGREAETPK